MKEYACPKCGSLDTFIDKRGVQNALCCGDCGAWLKWIGKKEMPLVEKYMKSKEQSNTNNVDDNYIKLKRIYELILHYENEYGRKIALETIEVSNKVRAIKTIDELLEDLENNK